MSKSPDVPPPPAADPVPQRDGTEPPEAASTTAAARRVKITRPAKKAELFEREGPRGTRWYARVRHPGHSEMKSFASRREAEDWQREQAQTLAGAKDARGLGPRKTSLAEALLDYAHYCSVNKKGVEREVGRINAYLAAAGLPVLKVRRQADGRARLEEQALAEQLAALPPPFAAHRDARVAKRPRSAELRARLAVTPVAKITTHALRDFCNALLDDGLSGDSIRLEFAILRHLFNIAVTEWHWVTLSSPFVGLKLPRRNKPRDRRLSTEEAARFYAALDDCRNPWVKPYVQLAIETAMRRSEMLLASTWADVDFGRRYIHLRDTKNGEARHVPLTQRALAILHALPRVEGEARVFPLLPNELKCAWARLLARAGIADFRVHDLRHEGASRHATRLQGNVFLLQKITGHKSVKVLERYVNPGFDELLAQLDATEPPPALPAQPPSANVVPFAPAARPDESGAAPLAETKRKPA